ncbi:hypothetical protein [Paenibacillus elgii]|uniref:hypothetical protein n=1 Tax=Paenibacillus elgii TaxID=189691 RepID=UPI0013D32B04|nr:hypothetical protein [Paenibacillus elgii]
MIETIKSYLVSLGFSVDPNSYNQATKAIGSVEQGIVKFAGSAVTKFALATTAVASFVAASSIGIAKFIGDLAQADLENEKLARQLWMSKDAAAAYNNTLKAMGVTLQDLYLSPELMQDFRQLNQQAKNLRPPTEFAEQMKMVRSIQFEFARMKLEATYALQWIGYYFVKYMEGPMKQIKQTLSEINGVIVKTMPSWTKIIAQVMSWFARMGIAAFRYFKDIVRIFNDLGSAIPRNLKLIGAAVAALGVIISTGPFGIITATLLSLILLLDDFYTYLDGGESLFGSFWKKLEDFYDKLKGSGVIDGFKKGWSEAFESISQGIETAGKEIAGFYEDLKKNGTLDNLEQAFANTFNIIEQIFNGAKKWVQDLYTELGKQGVLTDLKNNFEEVLGAVSNLFNGVTKLIDKLLGLDETKTTLGEIGKILRDVIIVSLQTVNDLLKGIAGYVNVISSITDGSVLDNTKQVGKSAAERLAEKPEISNQGFWESIWWTTQELTNKWKSQDFTDKFNRAMGLVAEAVSGNEGQNGGPVLGPPAPGYIYPQNTQNNTNNNTTVSMNPTFNIYGSDPKATAGAAQNHMESMFIRNMSGVIR